MPEPREKCSVAADGKHRLVARAGPRGRVVLKCEHCGLDRYQIVDGVSDDEANRIAERTRRERAQVESTAAYRASIERRDPLRDFIARRRQQRPVPTDEDRRDQHGRDAAGVRRGPRTTGRGQPDTPPDATS